MMLTDDKHKVQLRLKGMSLHFTFCRYFVLNQSIGQIENWIIIKSNIKHKSTLQFVKKKNTNAQTDDGAVWKL